jgi:hypothetical protein
LADKLIISAGTGSAGPHFKKGLAMSRTFGTLLVSMVSIILTASAFAADPERPRPVHPTWGTVRTATADSVTIAPELAVRKMSKAATKPADKPAEKPAELTFALSKDQTELMFAEVGMRRTMNDGTTIRTLIEPEPATAADLKAGQLVEVTPGDGAGDRAGAARRVIIAWSVPGTIVKVDGDTITFRPDAEPTGTAGATNRRDDAVGGDEQTLAISQTATRVRIATVVDERPAPDGRGVVRSVEYKAGTPADLKPDQSVVVCVRDHSAMKITVHTANEKP